MSRAQPFFSVIIPSYNRADFLMNTIPSVLQQQMTDFELLLIDDGSTDNTEEVVGGFAMNDQRIRYIYQTNAERGAARNNGIRNASGPYLVFFDSDDEMKNNYLRVLYDGIASHPGYDFYCANYVYNRDGVEVRSYMDQYSEGPYGVEMVLRGTTMGVLFCMKRDQQSFHLFPEERYIIEDWVFLVQNLQYKQIYFIKEDCIVVNDHLNRSMQNHKMLIKSRLNALQKINTTVKLLPGQSAIVNGFSYYFCAIYSYLDGDRRNALNYLLKAVKWKGIHLDFIGAFLKFMIGKKSIDKIKKYKWG